VELALDVLGGKWKTVILARIKEGPLSYGGLRKVIPELSDKVLSQKLKELVELSLLEQSGRSASERRQYRLTSHGQVIAPALEALYETGGLLAERLGVTFAATNGD
jgi:DNA-binding HxlR family transcriptional regulator